MLRQAEICAAGVALLVACVAAASGPLQVSIAGLAQNGDLPQSSAFCLPPWSGAQPQDKSPEIVWSAGPPGTKSYALLMVDPDVTADLSLMNKPGVTIKPDAPRIKIYHWVLVDIDAALHKIPAGAEGDGFVAGGKPIGVTQYGVRGTNDYWPYFNNNTRIPASMKGPYGGFDGPCPPSNDLLVHRYVFEIFALDVRSLGLSGRFFASDVLKAMQGHVLAEGESAAKFSFPVAPPGSPQGAAGLDGGAVDPSAAHR